MDSQNLEGIVKNIRTKSSVDKETGILESVTQITVSLRDLDPDQLAALALGESRLQPLSLSLGSLSGFEIKEG